MRDSTTCEFRVRKIVENIVKILYDYSEPDVVVEEELTESGEAKKKYKIKGTFSTIGERNKNGRIYPRHLWEAAVNKYQDVLKSGSINRLMEWEHPPRGTVDPMEAVACIDKVWIEGNRVMGEATILDNPKGNQLKTLVDNGIKLSVSSRGSGKVGAGGVVEKFDLITWDAVQNPSDRNATMEGYVAESAESYFLTESGELRPITAEEISKLENKADIDIANILKEAFNSQNEGLNPLIGLVNSFKSSSKNLITAFKKDANIKEFTQSIRKIEKLYAELIEEIDALEKEI